jgi:hypothetical protein
MGGKALNKYGVFTERKSTEEFQRIGLELQQRVYIDLHLVTAVVTCYRTKVDHGDLDLLISVSKDVQVDWKSYIHRTFQPSAININGGVYSFDHQDFQVDFIPIPEEKWQTALVYFSFDPLGNIMGKTFHKFGMSYGWEGLFYKYRNIHGTNSKDILLTNDVRRIFDFGGYDYDRYLKGFDTLEEIFKFCIDGKYFDAEMFQMENLKSIDKKRNRKRGSYHLFLNYIKDNGINTKYEFNPDKDYYLADIDVAFPEAKLVDVICLLKQKDAYAKAVADKFNGELVMEWLPDLKGKELGQAIGKFKDYWGEDFDSYIMNLPINIIKDCFMSVNNVTYKKNK